MNALLSILYRKSIEFTLKLTLLLIADKRLLKYFISEQCMHVSLSILYRVIAKRGLVAYGLVAVWLYGLR